MRWPNVERALVAYLKDIGPTYTETTGAMPDRYITVERVGGSGEWIDKNISIEVSVCSRLSRSDMWNLAGDVETAMWDLAASSAGGVYVDDVAVVFGFAFDPPPSQDVRRATATFSLTVRPAGA